MVSSCFCWMRYPFHSSTTNGVLNGKAPEYYWCIKQMKTTTKCLIIPELMWFACWLSSMILSLMSSWAGFNPSFKHPMCLATLKSCDKRNSQSVDDNIYIYWDHYELLVVSILGFMIDR